MSQFSLYKCLLSHIQGLIWTNLSNKISTYGSIYAHLVCITEI